MPVTLRQLRYFHAVVEHGSFSRAAERVFVSQPALSLQIRELEGAFGARLLDRDKQGVHLTRLGRDAHEQTLRILDEVLVLETMGKRLGSGPLRMVVGMVSTLTPYLLPGLIERLDAAPTLVEIDVREGSGQDLMADLLAGLLDAAILSLPLGLLELSERELFEDRFLLAGSPKRLAAFRALDDAPRPSDLAQSDIGPLLTLAEGHCLGQQVVGACSISRYAEVHRGAQSLATLSRLAAGDAGLTLLPETAALREQAACPGLELLRFAAPEPARRIGLAHRVAAEGQQWIEVLAEAANGAAHALLQEARDTIGAPSVPTPTTQQSVP